LKGLTFVGANNISAGIRITSAQAMSSELGYALIEDCVFKNFKATSASSYNNGLGVQGSFERVIVRNNKFLNIGRSASGTSTPLAATQACVVIDNRSVNPNIYPRYVIHEYNKYENIGGDDAQSSAANYDQDGFVIFQPYPGATGAPTYGATPKDKFADGTFLSRGNYYRNCVSRALKAQAYGYVENEIVVRDALVNGKIPSAFSEFAFQYGIGNASDIEFHYTDFDDGGTRKTPIPSSTDNILIDFYTPGTLGSAPPSLGASVKNIKIFWNIQDSLSNNISAIVSSWWRKQTPFHQVYMSDIVMDKGEVNHIAIGGLADEDNSANGFAQIVMENIVVDRVKYGAFGNLYLDYPTNGTTGNTTFIATNVKSRDGVRVPANAKFFSVYRDYVGASPSESSRSHEWYLNTKIFGDYNLGWKNPPSSNVTCNTSNNLIQLTGNATVSGVLNVSSNAFITGILNVSSNAAVTGIINLLSGQIKFPATANASSDVNTLDDYEEGNWSPEIKGTSGGAYTMGGLNGGTYTKIGRQVTIHGTIEWTARTTAYSGLFAVYGLPFPNGSQRCSGVLTAVNNGMRFSSATYSEWQVIIDPNVSYAYIIENAADGDGYSHGPTVDSTGLIYGFTLTYNV
jgi:hypothetical protein